MYKLVVFVAIVAIAFGSPVPEAKAEAKADPKAQFLTAYSAPIVAGAPVAYSAAYSAPFAYAAAPLAYSAYPAYAGYSSSVVTVF